MRHIKHDSELFGTSKNQILVISIKYKQFQNNYLMKNRKKKGKKVFKGIYKLYI